MSQFARATRDPDIFFLALGLYLCSSPGVHHPGRGATTHSGLLTGQPSAGGTRSPLGHAPSPSGERWRAEVMLRPPLSPLSTPSAPTEQPVSACDPLSRLPKTHPGNTPPRPPVTPFSSMLATEPRGRVVLHGQAGLELPSLLPAGKSLAVPMAPEDAADPAAVPAVPAGGKKSRKKRTEPPEPREDAPEGGAEAAERAAEIEGLTRAGRRALAQGDAREAVGCFRRALLLSGGTASPRLRRACAFNLGAAYVETGKPKKGFEFLLQSQPSEGESGERLGDLYFNIGAAHEGLRDFPKALEYFGRAGGRGHATQAGSRAGTRVQMGCCYLGMREPARAARCFLDAARTYAAAASPEAAAVALSRASGSMLQSRRFRAAEIAGVLAWCRSLCDSIPDPALRGNAAPQPTLGAPRGAAPAPGSPSLPHRETLQRRRPRLLPAPRLLPGCRELPARPDPLRHRAGPARGGGAAAEPGCCPQRPAQLRHGVGLAPASGGAAR